MEEKPNTGMDAIVPYLGELARNGHLANARTLAEDLLQQAPSIQLELLYARICAQMGDHQIARDTASRLLAQDASNAEAAAVLGAVDALARTGRREFWKPLAILLSIAVLCLLVFLTTRADSSSNKPPVTNNDIVRITQALERQSTQVQALSSQLAASVAATRVTTPPESALSAYHDIGSALTHYGDFSRFRHTPRFAGNTLVVDVNGTVATHHIKSQIQELSGHPNLIINVDQLGVSNRYQVRPNDTLSLIALLTYGNAARWTLIARANQDAILDNAKLSVGMDLTIPQRE